MFKLEINIKREFCQCCDYAWIDVQDEGQKTYYVCTMCRDHEPERFKEENSQDCNKSFDAGN